MLSLIRGLLNTEALINSNYLVGFFTNCIMILSILTNFIVYIAKSQCKVG